MTEIVFDPHVGNALICIGLALGAVFFPFIVAWYKKAVAKEEERKRRRPRNKDDDQYPPFSWPR